MVSWLALCLTGHSLQPADSGTPPHTTVSPNVLLMSWLRLLHDVDHPATVLTAIMNIRIWSVNYANPC